MKTYLHNPNVFSAQHKQKGMVLILVLSLLLALTILGVSSMSTSTLETRMANNFQDRNAAFQAAEAALREGERLVETKNYDGSQFDNQCTGGLCDCLKTSCQYSGDNTLTFWEQDTVWNTSTKHMTYTTISLTELASPAKYIVEHMGNVCPESDPSCVVTSTDPRMFRITAIGYGTTASAKVMLQSTYLK